MLYRKILSIVFGTAVLFLNPSSLVADELAGDVSGSGSTQPDTKAEALQPNPLSAVPKLPPVVVSAKPLTPTLLESGDPISVMDKDEIVRRSSSSLGETVDLQPGVRSSYFGPGASRPVVRGFAGDRVRVLRNGVGTGDVSHISEDHAVTADPLEAETIEVLRGPETLLYGSNAIGGSVNVIDGTIPETAVGKEITAEALLQMGNAADEERAFATSLKGQQESLNWRVSGFYRSTEDLQIPGFAESRAKREREELESDDHDHEDEGGDDHDEEESAPGRLLNSDTESGGFSLGGSHIWDKGFVGASFTGFFSKYGIPGGGHSHEHEDDEEEGLHEDEHSEHEGEEHRMFRSLDTRSLTRGLSEEGDESGPRIDLEQYRIDLRGQFREVASDIESINWKGMLSFYEHDEIEGDGAVATSYANDSYEFRTDAVHTLFGSGRGVFGTQILFEDFSATGEETFVSPTHTLSPALFAFHELPLAERIDLVLGGRAEYVYRDPQFLESQDFVPFALSVGTKWDPTGTNDYLAALNFAYTERAPSVVELFSDGQHLARGIYEIGDPNLSKESSWGIDLALKKNTGVITAGVTPFWQIFSDYINLSATGEEEDELPINIYENIDATFFGFEAVSSLHFDELFEMHGDTLAFDLQVDYVEARNRDVTGDLPRIPPLRTITRLRYDQARFGGFIEGVFVEQQNEVAPFELETDAYAMLNAQLEIKAPFENQRDLTFFVRGSNLTDEEARVHSSFLKDDAPLRGRAFLFGIRGFL